MSNGPGLRIKLGSRRLGQVQASLPKFFQATDQFCRKLNHMLHLTSYLLTLSTFRAMTRFRPCIDLHSGQVKQIVGGTLSTVSSDLKTNYISQLPASHFAQLYRDNDLTGAHVIMLGLGNERAAQEALSAWPGALQVGGGINERNAKLWIDRGAEKVGFPPRTTTININLKDW